MTESRSGRVQKVASAREVRVKSAITLGQMLKFSGVADTGGLAKSWVDAGSVRVNGEVERRRGRQLHQDDVVEVAGARLIVVREDEAGREKGSRNPE
jgi:ribosome-associated protein